MLLLGHVSVSLVLEGIAKLFSAMAIPFTFPLAMNKNSGFSTSSKNAGYFACLFVFYYGHPSEHEMMSLYGFDFHFCND